MIDIYPKKYWIPRKIDIRSASDIYQKEKKKKKEFVMDVKKRRRVNLFTFAVELLPQPLPKLLRVLLVVPPVPQVLHRPPAVLRVRERG